MDHAAVFSAFDRRSHWLQRAAELTPELQHWSVAPVAAVKPVADSGAFQGVRMQPVGAVSTILGRAFRAGTSFTLDFGETLVGRISLKLSAGGANDAPARLRITAAELPYEAAADFSSYCGVLSRAWLQDEVLNFDFLPGAFVLPRRYSLRYLKIEILCASEAVCFDEIHIEAESAVGAPLPVNEKLSPELRKLDEIGLRTLRNCTQTVMEDGPKRDRRLWLGDLRLQAHVNAASFRRFDVVERSLYLLAGLSSDEGRCPGAAYEQPAPRRSNDVVDYSLLLAPTLLDHWNFSGRDELPRELYPLARHQFALNRADFDENGLYVPPAGQWVFIDHRAGLDTSMALQGVYIYSLKALAELADRLGFTAEAAEFAAEAGLLTAAVRTHALDTQTCLVHSGPKRQVSYASMVWMILSGVLSPAEGRKGMESLRHSPNAAQPATPYLYHHIMEAYRICGMEEAGRALLLNYWGGMAKCGADTFFEIYVPGDDFFSPYGDALINSACHAWSCTSSCFLRDA